MVSEAAEVQVGSASPCYLTSAIGSYGGRCGASHIVLIGNRGLLPVGSYSIPTVS